MNLDVRWLSKVIQAGQKFRASTDLDVICLTHWRAPFTGGHRVVIPTGAEFQITYDPVEHATGVACSPVDYDQLHEVFVPPDERSAEGYDGYSLVVDITSIQRDCESVVDTT